MAANGYKGEILSGSGTTYSVSVTQDGSTFETVTATAMNLDSGADVPDGTDVVVIKIGANYFFQPPVFL